MCLNYEILFLANRESQVAQILFQLLVDCAMAKNLKISLSSLDFWDEFKSTIVTVLEDQLAHS